MQKITPFLWYDGKAEEAAQLYVSLFKNAKITEVRHSPGDTPSGPKGAVMTVTFEIEGQSFTALNGGPHFKFTPAISLFVDCDTQDEVDRLWDKLSEGGEKSRCGWLVDRYGVSWQIIPKALGRFLGDPDRAKAERAMKAMLQMGKIDIATLERAFNG